MMVKTEVGSNQREKSSTSSLITFMYSSVYPHFRHRLRKARCRKYATGSKEEGGREGGWCGTEIADALCVQSKPSAKGSPAPEWPPGDNAGSSQRF